MFHEMEKVENHCSTEFTSKASFGSTHASPYPPPSLPNCSSHLWHPNSCHRILQTHVIGSSHPLHTDCCPTVSFLICTSHCIVFLLNFPSTSHYSQYKVSLLDKAPLHLQSHLEPYLSHHTWLWQSSLSLLHKTFYL